MNKERTITDTYQELYDGVQTGIIKLEDYYTISFSPYWLTLQGVYTPELARNWGVLLDRTESDNDNFINFTGTRIRVVLEINDDGIQF